jgi:pilus assembly protein FimV
MFAETGGQSVDTHNSVFNSSFAPSASQLDTNEVDPVAEADVYIAYNFDTQAEDILKEALRNDPDAIRCA